MATRSETNRKYYLKKKALREEAEDYVPKPQSKRMVAKIAIEKLDIEAAALTEEIERMKLRLHSIKSHMA
jgi:hypothetical protein